MKMWNGQRVLILGAARQGLALARFLSGHGAQVILNDSQPAETVQPAVKAMAGESVRLVLGSHPLELLDQVDLVCVSGGVPLTLPILQEAQNRGMQLSNDSQIFMEAVGCPVIGITGSAGKTTTTSLVGRIARAALQSPRRTWVGGNIGLPLIDHVDEIQPQDLVILELSSFQLELMTISPTVAAVLNITPNHLDRHGTLEAYTAAKANILAYQTFDDVAVIGRDDPVAWSLAGKLKGRLVSFGAAKPLDHAGAFIADEEIYLWDGREATPVLPIERIVLPGQHNLQNVLAACAIAHAAGLPVEAMAAGIEGFEGVPHRLEYVRTLNEAEWYNDSIATAPERTIAAIRSFTEPLVLLLGGRDKNLPWQPLARLVRQRVDHVVLFGEAAGLIADAIGPVVVGERPFTVTRCSTLAEAVQSAAAVAEPGDKVLLSPGGTSFDEFRDFEERGEVFRKWVSELT